MEAGSEKEIVREGKLTSVLVQILQNPYDTDIWKYLCICGYIYEYVSYLFM